MASSILCGHGMSVFVETWGDEDKVEVEVEVEVEQE